MIEELRSAEGKKLAQEIRKRCEYEIPLRMAKTAMSEAEKGAASKDEYSTHCFNAKWDSAAETLNDKHPDDAQWKELSERWKKLCPEDEEG